MPSHPGAVDEFIDRFLQEAQIAANLNHPNVVTVYDYGIIDESGRPYLAMEYLDGRDLEMHLAHSGPFEAQRAVDLVLPVLDALDLAQQRGIVHKDLKPSNLHLVDEGTPRERLVLLDFGIARIYTDEGARLTQTGGFTGTPAYFAPEYVQHQIVTPAIDVYQMGLILAEMLIGVPAVVADGSMAYLLKHCSGDLSIPATLWESPLGPVLENALATDHTQRYANCGEFLRALSEVDLSQMTTHAPRTAGGPAVRQPTLEHSPTTDRLSSGSSTHRSAPFAGADVPEPSLEESARTTDASSDSGGAAGKTVAAVVGIVALLFAITFVGLKALQKPATPSEADQELPADEASPPANTPKPELATPEVPSPPETEEAPAIVTGASAEPPAAEVEEEQGEGREPAGPNAAPDPPTAPGPEDVATKTEEPKKPKKPRTVKKDRRTRPKPRRERPKPEPEPKTPPRTHQIID